MKTHTLFRKSLAWTLIFAAMNPALTDLAMARDTDIYLTVTSGVTTAEPNILIDLDTSDSMNLPEAWREYTGDYDSHVEYLWNDATIIGTSEVTAESDNAISDAAQSTSPFSPWGFWAGTTATDRQSLWQAVKLYAAATEGTDPGARSTWRNYNDLSWLYWVPTGTALTDDRLRSITFNRFRGYTNSTGSYVKVNTTTAQTPSTTGDTNGAGADGTNGLVAQRGGIPYPPKNAPYNVIHNYTGYNLCSSVSDQLTPSTVFAPSSVARNAGYYTNQQWIRWEPWLNLATVNNSSYPGAQTTFTFNGTAYAKGYVDGSIAPTNTASLPPTNSYRDSVNGSNTGASVSTGVTGQPIRIQQSGSYAGWTDVKADMGGYVFENFVNGTALQGVTLTQAMLTTLRGTYNYTYLTLPDTSTASVREQFSAWHGNRDSTPAFGSMTGTPAYYDTTVAACNPSTGPTDSGRCIPSTTTAQNATFTMPCTRSGTVSTEYDASNSARYYTSVGAQCVNAQGSPNCTTDPRSLSCVGLTPPTLNCGFSTQTTFFTRYFATNCAWSGQTPTTVGTCQWSGRQYVKIEGQGWYYYGGTCQENGYTQNCTMGGSTVTLNGTSYNNVTGPHANPGPNATYQTTTGCSNAVAAGTYNLGGTCGGATVYTVSGTATGSATNPNPTRTTTTGTTANSLCTITGGTAINIHGTGTQTYNQTCGNAGNLTPTACATREGTTCVTANTIAGSCSASVAGNVQAIASGSTYYQAYRQENVQNYLYHECLADGPTLNPSGTSYPTSVNRTFGTGANLNVTANPATGLTQAYTSSATTSQRYTADSSKNIDVYSVNYLNWKFGAKACRNSAGTLVTSGSTTAAGVTCLPIGRKNRLQIAKDALADLIQTTDGVRFGLEVFNKPAAAGGNDGGNIARRITRMGSNSADSDYSNRATLISALNAAVATARTPLTESLYEAYRYYSGRTPVWGTATDTAASGGTVSQGYDTTAICASANGLDCRVAGTYRSPMLNNPTTANPANCQKNFVIMITDGGPEDDYSANTAIKSMTYAGALGTVSPVTSIDQGGTSTTSGQFETAGLPYGPTDLVTGAPDGGYIWLDELAYFMSKADVSPGAQNFPSDSSSVDLILGTQQVRTFTIGFAGADSPVLANAAAKGNGEYKVAEDSRELAQALTESLTTIREWNPTIAAPTVPVSALNRTDTSTDVYLAFFQPSPNKSWLGTVKKYGIGLSETDCGTGTDTCLLGQTVLASGTRNIEVSETDAQGNVTTSIDDNAVSAWISTASPDGGRPDKGGTGNILTNQMVPGSSSTSYTPANRKVYTFIPHSGASPNLASDSADQVNEANTLISKTELGNAAMSDITRSTLINFIRGGNPGAAACSDATDTTPCTTWQSWPHGAVQHSQPAVVTYDVTTSPVKQYVYYLSDDGLLHAVDANTGAEQWVFAFEEAFANAAAIMANGAGSEIDVADGTPVVYVQDTNGDGVISSGERVWLFVGLRRGGRAYYALDVTVPAQPQFMWRISTNGTTDQLCDQLGNCTSNGSYTNLGQTWSTPVVANVRAIGTTNPALIFGGGYDPLEDAAPYVPNGTTGGDTIGAGVYIVNALSGALVKRFDNGNVTGGMKYSVPSDITALNVDFDALGYVDRLYVGDLGGNVYRFDIASSSAANWTGKVFASLSDSSGEKRKIFYPPAVASQSVPFKFSAVYVGSGDKEHPLLTSTTNPHSATDRIFMLMDRDYAIGPASAAAAITVSDLIALDSSSALANAGTTAAALTLAKGWYRTLDDGEKVTNRPSVFNQRLRFATYAPLGQSNACVPPGEGRLNEIGAQFGTLYDINQTGNVSRYYSDTSSGYQSAGIYLIAPGAGTTQDSNGNQTCSGAGCCTGSGCQCTSDSCTCTDPAQCSIQNSCNKPIKYFTCSGADCHSRQVGCVGGATKIYWYMEPEQ